MATIEVRLKDESTARGFAEGVRYVNDSACEVTDIKQPTESEWAWVVVLEDDDYTEDHTIHLT